MIKVFMFSFFTCGSGVGLLGSSERSTRWGVPCDGAVEGGGVKVEDSTCAGGGGEGAEGGLNAGGGE